MSARRLDEEEGLDTPVPGECELKYLTVTYSLPMFTVLDGWSTEFSGWTIGIADGFDKGYACGKVDDRRTSLTGFEQALERRDGHGFGNPLFSRVIFRTLGRVIDTKISSSEVTAISVDSFGGPQSYSAPATMGYGQTFYSSHVFFTNDVSIGQYSFPVLFHDHSGCLGEGVDFDVYGSALVGYGNFWGGNLTSVTSGTDVDNNIFSRTRDNVVMLSEEELSNYLYMQLYCDVSAEPMLTEAGYSMCSDSAGWYGAPEAGTLAMPIPFPNVTTSVGGCPISVLPARFMAVGNFGTDTLESRINQWSENLIPVQTKMASQKIDALASVSRATSLVTQSSTQVGFALPEANNFTEWVLTLVVAVEALFVVLAALAALISSAPDGFVRRGPTPRREWVMIVGGIFALGALLVLGITPVFFGWDSEKEAEGMAHNDVFYYVGDESMCFEASWDGDGGLGQWCMSLRTTSVTLVVRWYVSTFNGRYAGLAISSAVLGGASWIAYVVLKTVYVRRVRELPKHSVEASSLVTGGSEATPFPPPA
ncbi:unnamed protein product [Scytosiphon promiscuus]